MVGWPDGRTGRRCGGSCCQRQTDANGRATDGPIDRKGERGREGERTCPICPPPHTLAPSYGSQRSREIFRLDRGEQEGGGRGKRSVRFRKRNSSKVAAIRFPPARSSSSLTCCCSRWMPTSKGTFKFLGHHPPVSGRASERGDGRQVARIMHTEREKEWSDGDIGEDSTGWD